MRALLLCFLLWPGVVDAATYYVHATRGSDANPGTSAMAPWQTINKVNTSSLSAGDTIYFRCGEVWRETLTVPSSGSSSAAVTFDAYGDCGSRAASGWGAFVNAPLISGADIKPNTAFAADSGYAYTTTYSLIAAGTIMVRENGTRLTAQASAAAVQSTPGSFFLTGTTLYVSASDGTDIRTNGKVYEVPGRTVGIYSNGKTFVKIRNFHVIRTDGDNTTYGGIVISGDDNLAEYNTANDHRRHGLQVLSESGIHSRRNIVQYNDLSDSWATFTASVFEQNVSETCTDTIVRYNDFHDAPNLTNAGLLTVHGSNTTHRVLRTKVYGNRLHDSLGTTQTIQFYDDDDLAFFGNWIYGTLNANMVYVLTRGSGIRLMSNFVNMASLGANIDAFFIQDVTGVRVLHNFFYGQNGRWAVRFFTNATGAIVQNNIFHTVSKVINVDATAQSGFTMDYNDAYNVTAGATWGKWGATEYTFANWKTNSSQDANTVEVDPQVPSLTAANWPTSNLFVPRISPLHHAGKHAQGARDARGYRFFMGGRPTIGPYEYAAGDSAGTRVLR